VRARLHTAACSVIPDAVALIVDDTGIVKKGGKSPGVQRQYTGSAGKVTNCQVVVSTHLAAHEASCALEMDLYLPESWASDAPRRAEAQIPGEVAFRTKHQIAIDQIDRIRGNVDAPRLVLADAAYGDAGPFRHALDERGLRYSVGLSSSFQVWRPGEGPDAPAPWSGRGRRPHRRFPGEFTPVAVRQLAHELSEEEWVDIALRPGRKDERRYRFARLRVRSATRAIQGKPPGPQRWLLIEWPAGEDEPSHYFLSSLDEDVSIEELARLSKLRWRVEQDYREMKQEVGFTHYEGRRWHGFSRHLTICMAAMTWLVGCRALSPPASTPLPA